VRAEVACGSVSVASLGAAEVTQDSMALHRPKAAESPLYRISDVLLPDAGLTATVRARASVCRTRSRTHARTLLRVCWSVWVCA
jgi:hypothetical protein